MFYINKSKQIILFPYFKKLMITEVKSPLKRKSSIVSLLSSSIQRESKIKKYQEIDNLVNKFNQLNNKIQIQADQSNFNLIEYERQNDKLKYDPQMMTAKLRKLQNRAQIKRAQMQIQNREKGKFKRKQLKKSKVNPNGYKTIYQQFLKDKKKFRDVSEYSDDQSNAEDQNNPKTIAFFSKLRSHPKILEFTLKKIQNKNKQQQDRLKKVSVMIQNHKKSRDNIHQQFRDLLQECTKSNQLNKTCNPETVIQNQGNKFYTKKSSQNINKDMSMLPRCGKMMQKQSKILSEIDDKSLSKQNKKKLKNRLNQIIMSIGKSQKIKSKHTLPKIDLNRGPESSR